MSSEQVISKSVVFAPHDGARNLVICCSGRRMGYQADKYSFRKRTQGLAVNRLFIRDNFGLWYQAGLDEVTSGIEDTAAYLRDFCRSGAYDKITTVGVSSGGYAALLFGALVGAHAIHSVSPRTLLSHDAEAHTDRNRHGVQQSLTELMAFEGRQEQYFDLSKALRDQPAPRDTCKVYFDPEHSLDAFHSERMASVPWVTFETFPGAGHALGRKVIQEGDLLSALVQ